MEDETLSIELREFHEGYRFLILYIEGSDGKYDFRVWLESDKILKKVDL